MIIKVTEFIDIVVCQRQPLFLTHPLIELDQDFNCVKPKDWIKRIMSKLRLWLLTFGLTIFDQFML